MFTFRKIVFQSLSSSLNNIFFTFNNILEKYSHLTNIKHSALYWFHNVKTMNGKRTIHLVSHKVNIQENSLADRHDLLLTIKL